MNARAALPAAAGLLLAGCLAGCGIPTTGVVEAGEPAAGVHQDVTLYFVRTQDGALATTQRRADGPVDTGVAVGMLLKGVGEMEQKMLDLTTELPPGPATVSTRGGTVTVDLHTAAERLTGTAVDQIVCTVLANRRATARGVGPAQITVTADGTPVAGPQDDSPCAAAENSWPAKPPNLPTAAQRDRPSGG